MIPYRTVGIGGSAGSLQAIKSILTHLPNDTGMAFIVIMHLGNESWLSRILSECTSMPVTQVNHSSEKIFPNHVYVNAPNTNIVYRDKSLYASLSDKKWGCPTVIDAFFLSLAKGATNRAVGVILSGLLWDGAEGIRYIKAVNGSTIAQSLMTSAHAGMPSAAMATGCVDFVGAPSEIAQHLALLAKTNLFSLNEINL